MEKADMPDDESHKDTTVTDDAYDACEKQRLDRLLDEALMDTFPASDPFAFYLPVPARPKSFG